MPILTAKVGGNADQLPEILEIHANKGDLIADITHGKGIFWKKAKGYRVIGSDIERPKNLIADLRALPYPASTFDVVILDPPYGHSSTASIKKILAVGYNLNSVRGRKSIMDLYSGGIREAKRVLKSQKLLIVKCQDEIESGKQNWNHITIKDMAEKKGFYAKDLFIMVQTGVPTMRHNYQLHARKNHSYWWIFRNGGPKTS